MYSQALIYLYNIAPNETKTLDFTFDHTAPQGMLEFSCHYGGHYEAGMHQAIVVNAAPGASVSPYSNNAIPLTANRTSGITTGPCDQPITTKIVNSTYTPASVSLKRGDTLSVITTGSETIPSRQSEGARLTVVGPGKTKYVAFPKLAPL